MFCAECVKSLFDHGITLCPICHADISEWIACYEHQEEDEDYESEEEAENAA